LDSSVNVFLDALSCGTCRIPFPSSIFLIGTGIMAFSIAIAASVTTTSTALLCKGGALRMFHSCNHGFAILVQKMQSLLTVLGTTIVSGVEIVLRIRLEVTVLRYVMLIGR
jgi:hypothetical protein